MSKIDGDWRKKTLESMTLSDTDREDGTLLIEGVKVTKVELEVLVQKVRAQGELGGAVVDADDNQIEKTPPEEQKKNMLAMVHLIGMQDTLLGLLAVTYKVADAFKLGKLNKNDMDISIKPLIIYKMSINGAVSNNGIMVKLETPEGVFEFDGLAKRMDEVTPLAIELKINNSLGRNNEGRVPADGWNKPLNIEDAMRWVIEPENVDKVTSVEDTQ